MCLCKSSLELSYPFREPRQRQRLSRLLAAITEAARAEEAVKRVQQLHGSHSTKDLALAVTLQLAAAYHAADRRAEALQAYHRALKHGQQVLKHSLNSPLQQACSWLSESLWLAGSASTCEHWEHFHQAGQLSCRSTRVSNSTRPAANQCSKIACQSCQQSWRRSAAARPAPGTTAERCSVLSLLLACHMYCMLALFMPKVISTGDVCHLSRAACRKPSLLWKAVWNWRWIHRQLSI